MKLKLYLENVELPITVTLDSDCSANASNIDGLRLTEKEMRNLIFLMNILLSCLGEENVTLRGCSK